MVFRKDCGLFIVFILTADDDVYLVGAGRPSGTERFIDSHSRFRKSVSAASMRIMLSPILSSTLSQVSNP